MKKKLSHNRNFFVFLMPFIIFTLLVSTVNVQSYAIPFPQEDSPFETIAIPADATFKGFDVNFEKQVKGSGMDSALQDLSTTAKVSPQSAFDFASSRGMSLSEDRVQVQIVTDAAHLNMAIEVVESAGGEVTVVGDNERLFQAWLPIGALDTVSNDKNVFYIRQPVPMVLMEDLKAGTYNTEGLAALNGAAWHASGFNGTGVKIGIIDGGFLGYPTLLGTDLPASVTVKNFVDGQTDAQVNGSSTHGTACAEIIHDIAPGASLYLAKISTNLDLQEAVTWMINTNQVDIISTSLGWYNVTPGDGTGEFASLVQTARNAGILWVTAAGNDREAHWGGPYYDPEGDGTHNFTVSQDVNYFGPGNGDGYLIPSGYLFTVAARWDDWVNVNQDYDLYLLRWNGSDWEVVGYSWNEQAGVPGQEPTEYAQVVTSGANAVYGIGIDCYSCSRNVNFEVFAPKLARLDQVVNARSLANLADVPLAFTVAALDVNSPYPQEPYSSEGPTNGPGGTAVGGIVKPDISGFANVSTVSYGIVSKFNGTSAATPHVAGAAALVLSAYPAYTPDQLQAYLQGRSVDMGIVGKDNIFGFGRLNLGTPPNFSMTVTGISPNIGMVNQVGPVTITGTNFTNVNAVKLTKTGQSDVPAPSFTVVNATTITATINLTGVQTGLWNVVVSNTDNFSTQLANGFTVWEPSSFIYIPMLIK